jgi:integrase
LTFAGNRVYQWGKQCEGTRSMRSTTKRTKPATVAEVNAMRSAGRHSVGDSLILAVSASGSRSWIARVRDPIGKRRDIGLGPFADLSLSEAREKARLLRRAGREGEEVLTKAQRRKAARAVPTFEEAARRVHEERKGVWKNGKHVDQWIATLEAHVFPKIGQLPVDQVGAAQVIDVLSPIWQATPETARRVRQRICAVVDWSHAREYRSTQVSMKAVGLGLGPQREGKGNFPALAYAQVPALVATLREAESFGRLALEFLILTAARSGEVRGAVWTEIDEDGALWTIPGDRMKGGKEHVVPLTDRALQIVQRMKEWSSSKTLVFPGISGKLTSDGTLAKVLRAAGVSPASGSVHGMRSAFRDWVSEETSFPGDVAEAALAHALKNKVEAAYRRGNLLAKRREMMRAWGEYCDGQRKVVRLAAST